MTRETFILSRPETQTSAVVFASPHSGRRYPRSFLQRSVLDEQVIRSSEDAFVDRLIRNAPSCGAPLLCAQMPRAYLDLNRAADELDPAVVDGVRNVAHNPRISSGLGVIPRVVANGREIYRSKITQAEARSRIESVWAPYHMALASTIERTRAQFGETILVDCHSMPREAGDAVGGPGKSRADIILGDRFGASAAGRIMDRIEQVFVTAGLRVSRNIPFAGAYIVQHYGRPSRNQHAVQIEIDRSLYMDEAQIMPNGNFAEFEALMGRIVAEIADLGRQVMPLAAE